MKKSFFCLLLIGMTLTTNAERQYVVQTHLTTLDGLPSNTVRYIMQDSYGYLWFSTTNGLSRYDGYSIRNYRQKEGIQNVRISHTREQSDGSLAIVTTVGNLYRLSPGADTVVWLMNDLHEHRPAYSTALYDTVVAVYQSMGGEYEAHAHAIRYVARDRDGSIWVGMEHYGCEQLVDYQQQWAKVVHPIADSNSPIDSWRYLAQVGTKIEVGNSNGDIVIYDSLMNRIVGRKKMPGNVYCSIQMANGVTRYGIRYDNDAYDYLIDQKGRIWEATLGHGLRVYDRVGKLLRVFLSQEYYMARVRSLVEDRNGMIWAGTSAGLLVFDPNVLLQDSTAYYQYSTSGRALHSDEIRCIYIDSKQQVYVSEAGEGFAQTSVPENGDYAHLRFDHFSTAQGLSNNMVQSFVEDKDGKIWMSTEYGLSCLDKGKVALVSYLPTRRMSNLVFSELSSMCLSDGRIVFGSSHGLMVIDPQNVPAVKKTKIPQLVAIRTNEDGSLYASFSTFHYAAHIRDQYAFRLDPIETTYSSASARNEVEYYRLSPGQYTLYVRALNEDGQWSEEQTVAVVIPTPWWNSTCARCLYWFFGLGLFSLLIYLLWSRLRIHNQMKMDEQINEAKLVFFTNISHEFRTPLTLIHGAIEHILHTDDVPETIQNQITILRRNSDRLLRLIDQLLEFRRMQNKVMAVRVEPVEVIGLLRELGESFRPQAESKRLEYRFVASQDSQQAWVDRGNLDKVFYNLLSNAIKYTPDGGKVMMECIVYRDDSGNRWLRAVVSDTGIGVSKKQQNLLFDQRFVQSMQLRQSMGIGLNLCAALVEVHHGQIRYEENPGGGSRFVVELPIERGAYAENEVLQSIETERMTDSSVLIELEKPYNDQRILLIEDDADMRTYVAGELRTYFQVETASDGEEGLRRMEDDGFDLIVTDLMMPGISGMDVVKRVRENLLTSHLPVVLLTAKDSVDSKIQSMQIGADAYITKPFSTRLLVATIINLINQRAQLREKFSNDLSMLHPIVTTNDADKTFFEQLDALVDENMDNSEISADVFARKMLLGRTVFFRKVKEVTGYSPKEYLRVRRMKRAAELLQEGKLSISEIAYTVGISDPFYFSKCFKQQFGMTPSAYQKECTKE